MSPVGQHTSVLVCASEVVASDDASWPPKERLTASANVSRSHTPVVLHLVDFAVVDDQLALHVSESAETKVAMLKELAALQSLVRDAVHERGDHGELIQFVWFGHATRDDLLPIGRGEGIV